MTNRSGSNKARHAVRVIEVLEFFARENRPATVAEIVAQFDRPQSSTSELLGSLVNLGVLYREPGSRTYFPTPRLAALAMALQPRPISNGKLFEFIDRLAHLTRCGVGLFGMVGTDVQVWRWADGSGNKRKRSLTGTLVPLSSSAVGPLLLSNLEAETAKGLLWRLNAEIGASNRFNMAAMVATVARSGEQGHVTGPSGFTAGKQMTAILLPPDFGYRGLSVGVEYDAKGAVDSEAIVATLRRGVKSCVREDAEDEVSFIAAISDQDQQSLAL